jgi:hypothetical protein
VDAKPVISEKKPPEGPIRMRGCPHLFPKRAV